MICACGTRMRCNFTVAVSENMRNRNYVCPACDNRAKSLEILVQPTTDKPAVLRLHDNIVRACTDQHVSLSHAKQFLEEAWGKPVAQISDQASRTAWQKQLGLIADFAAWINRHCLGFTEKLTNENRN